MLFRSITIEGRMESRKWVDKDGNNRISWGVTCDNVEFPLGKSGNAVQSDTNGFVEVPNDEELPF